MHSGNFAVVSILSEQASYVDEKPRLTTVNLGFLALYQMVLGSFQCRGVLLLWHRGKDLLCLQQVRDRWAVFFFFFFFFFISSRLSYLSFSNASSLTGLDMTEILWSRPL